jgi:hypothetical protein
VPLSFVVRYLYDNALVKLANTMEFEVDEKIPEGPPVTSWMTTKFSVTMEKVETWGYWIYGDGAVQLRLLSLDNDTGNETTLYTSPCNTHCNTEKRAWAIAETPWTQGAYPVTLTWSSGSFQFENRPGLRFIIECLVWNYKDNSSATGRITYTWDSNRASYQPVVGITPGSCEAHTKGNDMNGKFSFSLFLDDKRS